MKSLKYITTQTPVGDFHIIVDGSDTALVSGFGSVESLVGRLPVSSGGYALSVAREHEYQNKVRLYFLGDKESLRSIPVSQEGSDFQKEIWSELGRIPYGETRTYKQVAAGASSPGAVRAVGSTCAANKLILIIPCHRVIKTDGGLGEYFYGSDLKQSLLDLESSTKVS